MAWTLADLAAVRAALAKGERSVTFADRSVVYRSVEELLRVKAEMEAELAVAASRPKQWAAYSSKGLSS